MGTIQQKGGPKPKQPPALFVTADGHILINDEGDSKSVNKYIVSEYYLTEGTTVMSTNSPCVGLFVDINDTLYCSIRDDHRVVKRKLTDQQSPLNIVAGWMQATPEGSRSGFSSNLLSSPNGIFVDTNLDLYVADTGNSRIQRFPVHQINRTTVAGKASLPYPIDLLFPMSIILDADKNLFIADTRDGQVGVFFSQVKSQSFLKNLKSSQVVQALKNFQVEPSQVTYEKRQVKVKSFLKATQVESSQVASKKSQVKVKIRVKSSHFSLN